MDYIRITKENSGITKLGLQKAGLQKVGLQKAGLQKHALGLQRDYKKRL